MREKVAACALVVPFALGWLAAPSHPGDPVFRFEDTTIVESSGLVVEGGLFVTTNDSGDSGRVFAVDPDSGETVGVTRWSEDPTDVEALAPAGDRSVWVGDIGDNEAQRDSIEVTRVPVGAAEVTVDEPTYDLVYPEGAVNAETPAGPAAHGPALRRHQGRLRRRPLRRSHPAGPGPRQPPAPGRAPSSPSPPTARSSRTGGT